MAIIDRIDRKYRFEMIAALIFGGTVDNEFEPEPGWKGALARQLGMNKNAVADTLKQPHGELFDRRFANFVSKRRMQMLRAVELLPHLEAKLRGSKDEVLHLWIVDQVLDRVPSRSVVWAHDPGELAAYFIQSEWSDEAIAAAEISYTPASARGKAFDNWQIKVSFMPQAATRPLLDDDLGDAKRLLDRIGTRLDLDKVRAGVKP